MVLAKIFFKSYLMIILGVYQCAPPPSLQAFQLNKPLFTAKVAKTKVSMHIIDFVLLSGGKDGEKFKSKIGNYNLMVSDTDGRTVRIETNPDKVKEAVEIALAMPRGDNNAIFRKIVELYGKES